MHLDNRQLKKSRSKLLRKVQALAQAKHRVAVQIKRLRELQLRTKTRMTSMRAKSEKQLK